MTNFSMEIKLGKDGVVRDTFLETISLILYSEIDNNFIVLIKEMAKNIFDYTDGRGRIIVKKENNRVEFEVFDFGADSYDFKSLRERASSRVVNGVNFDAGLDSIVKIAKKYNIKLEIDTSRGFHYRGVYRPL